MRAPSDCATDAGHLGAAVAVDRVSRVPHYTRRPLSREKAARTHSARRGNPSLSFTNGALCEGTVSLLLRGVSCVFSVMLVVRRERAASKKFPSSVLVQYKPAYNVHVKSRLFSAVRVLSSAGNSGFPCLRNSRGDICCDGHRFLFSGASRRAVELNPAGFLSLNKKALGDREERATLKCRLERRKQ